jgi:hypothetical protein
MTPSPPRLEIYNSPKRKRGGADSIEYSPQVSPRTLRIATRPSEYPFPQPSTERSEQPQGGSSPSSKVAGQLRSLDLQGTFVRRIAFTDAGHAKKRFAQTSDERGSHNPPNGCTDNGDKRALSLAESVNDVLPAAVNSHLQASESPSNIVDRPLAHSRSPPLDGDPEDNPMTWHESEITGHNPTDPNDDGYGINGIGFKPTPAIAWARSQKRKQQLADCRNREAREARQLRSERRRAESRELSAERAEKVKRKSAKVRFGDMD